MAISLVGAVADTSATAGATTTAATLPTGIASGDLIIMMLGRNVDAVLTTAPAGYTFLRTLTDLGGTSPAAANVDLYWRAADGTEGTTGPTVAASSAGATTLWITTAAVYRGVDVVAGPFIAENGQSQPSGSTSRAAPAITNTDANAWAVFMTFQRQVATLASFTPPTGMTERIDVDRGSSSTTNPATEWADSFGPVATSTITYTATASASSAIAVSWAAFLLPLSGPTVVNVADAGSGDGVLSVAATVPVAESVAGDGVLSVSATVPQAETGAGADTLTVAAQVPLADTFTGIGAEGVAVLQVTSVADAGAGADDATVAVAVSLDDFVNGVDFADHVVPTHTSTSATLAGTGVSTALLAGNGLGTAVLAGDGLGDATVNLT